MNSASSAAGAGLIPRADQSASRCRSMVAASARTADSSVFGPFATATAGATSPPATATPNSAALRSDDMVTPADACLSVARRTPGRFDFNLFVPVCRGNAGRAGVFQPSMSLGTTGEGAHARYVRACRRLRRHRPPGTVGKTTLLTAPGPIPMRSLLAAALLLTVGLRSPTAPAADPKPVPKGPLSEARQRLLRGNYAEARAAYEKFLADQQLGPAAAAGVARAWRAEGEYDKARAALDAAVKAFPDQPDLLAARGDLLYSLGRWDEAAADADRALKSDGGHFLARWVRARILRDRGDTAGADQEVRWFVRTYSARSQADNDITDPDTLLLVAEAGAENARWHNLPNQFRFILNDVIADALKYDPDLWPAENFAGEMLLEKYNRPDALEAFD